MARYGAESATFGGVVFKRAKIWGGCFGYWKIQNGPSVFHIDPLHGLIWPRCKGQFSPKFWYQNSPISVGLNWPQKQYHSGLTRFGPIFGAKLALFILQCRKYLSRSSTASLVHAFVNSRVEYCNSLMCGLQRVLNASARLMYCASKPCPITPLLHELHWLPVCYRIEYKILLLTFNVLHDMAPDYLRQSISVLPPSKYDLRRNHDSGILLATPKFRKNITLRDRSFSCAAPILWNLLPSTMRSISSLNLFKNGLKKLSYLVRLLIRNF